MAKTKKEAEQNPKGFPWEWPNGHYCVGSNGFHVHDGKISVSPGRQSMFNEVTKRVHAVEEVIAANNKFLLAYGAETSALQQRFWEAIHEDFGIPGTPEGFELFYKNGTITVHPKAQPEVSR